MGDEMIPPPLEPPVSTSGYVLGGFCGLVLSIVFSLINLTAVDRFHTSCRSGVIVGIGELLIAACLAWATWHVFFRGTGRGFSMGFLRGCLAVMTVFFLIPWPCSLTGVAGASFMACR